jgi:hypothetical protein
MVHCGFEPTAVNDAFANPLKAAWVAMRGSRIDGPMVSDPLMEFDVSTAVPVEVTSNAVLQQGVIAHAQEQDLHDAGNGEKKSGADLRRVA